MKDTYTGLYYNEHRGEYRVWQHNWPSDSFVVMNRKQFQQLKEMLRTFPELFNLREYIEEEEVKRG